MKFMTLILTGIIVLVSVSSSDAQTVVHVSQMLPFASSGTVSSLAKGVVPTSTPASGSGSETSIASTGNATLTGEGGRVVTGENGASSLLLGTSGTARMGADSELKVPEATEKNHSLELLKGRLFMNIRGEELKKRGNAEFRLKTPTALLAVKGTKFFTISENGTDTIGVHEGSVTVTEPASGKSIELEAGSAVNTSPGILSEMRAMTDEEKGYVPEYAAADLVSAPIPVAIKSPVPNTKKLQILLYQNGRLSVLGEEGMDLVHYGTRLDPQMGPYLDWRVLKSGRNSFPVSPRLTADGTVHYSWTAKEPGAVYQCYFDFGGQSRTNYSDDSYTRLNRVNPPPLTENLQGTPVAIQFRARVKNVSGAFFVFGGQTGFNRNGAAAGSEGSGTKAWDALAAAEDWVDVLMLPKQTPASKGSPGSRVFPYSYLRLVGSFKQGSTAATVMALELADFVLLTTPK